MLFAAFRPLLVVDLTVKNYRLSQARDVCCCLFKDDHDSRWSSVMREMLFASVLRFYPELVKLLDQHPTSKHKDCMHIPSCVFCFRV